MKTVMQMFMLQDNRKVEGDLGVEIEVEGHNLPGAMAMWRREEDGSLRGESAEYVLKKPVTVEGLKKALSILDKAYVDMGSKVEESVRAGVHVHVNVQNLNTIELFNFVTSYYILEELLVNYCGESRVGNLFCLRACDADYVLDFVVDVVKRKRWRHLVSDNIRYAALNFKSLGEYGSLEFRSLRSTRDLSVVQTWAEILLTLRNNSIKFTDPKDVIGAFSAGGGEAFVTKLLGDYAYIFTQMPGFEKMLTRGMRNAQELAFCCDWQAFYHEKAPVNPFAAAMFDEFDQHAVQF